MKIDFQLPKVDAVNGVITYEGEYFPLTLANLINIIIDFVNALIRNEF